MPVFFQKSDYIYYLKILQKQAFRYHVDVWCYCLMENHVHLIVVPREKESLGLMFREAHRRYTRMINQREGWQGHLWQDRFASFPMNKSHALMAARYIENNPVHSGTVKFAEDYPWSSVHYHLGQAVDPLIRSRHALQDLVLDWKGFLRDDSNIQARESELIESHIQNGKALI